MAIGRSVKLVDNPVSILSGFDRRKWNIGLKLAYLALQLTDLGLTLFAINLGYHELNPYIRGILSAPLQLYLVKSVIPAMIALLIPGKFLIPAILLLAMIVGWNVKELLLVVF